jgi:hypothetical protein
LGDNFTHRNHYIPQRYQQGFANGEGKVWLFDRKTLEFRDGAPVNIGVQRDFYTTVNADGVPNDSVEKLFAMLEGEVWPIIDNLDRHGESVTPDGRIYLSLFVALMRTRTPVFDQISNNTTDVVFKWIAKARSPSPEAIAEQYAKATGKAIDDDQAQEIFNAIRDNRYEIRTPRQNTIKTMLGIAIALGEAIIAMDWTIYRTASDHTFVTSDNPFIVVPSPGTDPTLSGTGPLSPGATCLIPLSKRTLLTTRKDGGGPFRCVNANRDFVRFANYCVATDCDRFLIARDEPLLRKLVKATKVDQWQNSFMPSVISPPASSG